MTDDHDPDAWPEPAEGRDPDALAAALSAGPWTAATMALRLAHALGRILPSAGVRDVVAELLDRWPERPDSAELAAYLTEVGPGLDADVPAEPPAPDPTEPGVPTVRMYRPANRIRTRADLLRLLSLTDQELDWFADRQARTTRAAAGPLTHYRHRIVASGSRVRVLEIPKPRLREIQRRLNRHVVHQLPLHPSAHGAVLGRSVRTCAEPHAGQQVVLRCDLEGFFSAVTAARVRGQLHLLDIEDEAADLVAALCTTQLPSAVWRAVPRPDGTAREGGMAAADRLSAHWRMGRRLAVPHLPQGAPTSSGLANAITFGLDHRLSRLADSVGARYTRYVDDLIFSGDRGLPVGALLAGVRSVVADEGFRLAANKTAVLGRARRQRVLGVVVNEGPAVARTERDRLRAILHNCARHGAASQAGGQPVAEFAAALRGRLAWVASVHPGHGATLLAQFAAIDWN